MTKLIAWCGMDCASCDAYVATVKDDDELRAKVAEAWSKMFEGNFKPEDINCTGCTLPEGAHVAYCYECVIRKCGIEKAVANCAYCSEFPCEKLEIHFKYVAPGAKETLEEINKTIKKEQQ